MIFGFALLQPTSVNRRGGDQSYTFLQSYLIIGYFQIILRLSLADPRLQEAMETNQ